MLDHYTIASEWINAWNARDLDRIVAHYSDDIVFSSPFVEKLLGEPSGEIRGKATLRQYFEKGLATYPDLRFRLRKVFGGARSVVLVYDSVNALTAAEYLDIGPDGRITRSAAHYTRE